jgi:hypothetical protein
MIVAEEEISLESAHDVLLVATSLQLEVLLAQLPSIHKYWLRFFCCEAQ